MRGLRAGGAQDPFLDQLRLIQTPWFGVYIHVIHRPDEPDPHDHPWWFASLILDGGYQELVYPDKRDPARFFSRTRTRFSLGHVSLRSAHRITLTYGPVWTLVLTGPQKNEWGFYPGGRFVPWREYQNAEGA